MTHRVCSAGAEGFMCKGRIPVLDQGYIALVDYAGNDGTVVAAARQSYDKAFDEADEVGNERLINFLMREWHTSPFEQPMMAFEVKAPIMVFREWHRHRLARLNEMSGRYTELEAEYYIPEPSRVQVQSKTNKQGSGEAMSEQDAEFFRSILMESCKGSFEMYNKALSMGVSKEIARLGLPVNTYSKMVWQSDLRNILGFIRLRDAPKAQFEIRKYAEVISSMVSSAYPKVWNAYDEHVLNAMTFSKTEMLTLKRMRIHHDGYCPDMSRDAFEKIANKIERYTVR